MNNQADVAVARARAALVSNEAARASGSPSAIAAAKVQLHVSRRELELAKAEQGVFTAMKQAMAKAQPSPVNKLHFTKAAGGRRPGATPFLGPRSASR